jgi:(5-formylfuran-3-yl)methyl phosphate synthase
MAKRFADLIGGSKKLKMMPEHSRMNDTTFDFARPGLLVSVRNVTEAQTALSAGADVIDVKEPNRGPLGAADVEEIAAIVGAVQSRVPVTAAFGELLEPPDTAKHGVMDSDVRTGISLFKIGLAGCGLVNDWQARWANVISSWGHESRISHARPVAVAYADWQAADAPKPQEVLNAGIELGCPALLVDTWNKSFGGLFEHWPATSLHDFVRRVQHQGMVVVLAGSLTGDQIREAASLGPDLIAVRGAACEISRNGEVSFDRVRALKQLLPSSAFPRTNRPRESKTRQW